MSPNLREILTGSEMEEDPTLILPDVTKNEMSFLLGLLYSGSINMYKT
jgi:hypothetical protein